MSVQGSSTYLGIFIEFYRIIRSKLEVGLNFEVHLMKLRVDNITNSLCFLFFTCIQDCSHFLENLCQKSPEWGVASGALKSNPRRPPTFVGADYESPRKIEKMATSVRPPPGAIPGTH